jgi:hypothetical protein
MLHKETVEPRTLELLKELMQLNALKDFALLGGTSLSLRWGHRISEDIDLFSNIMFDEMAVTEAITNHFSNTIVLAQDKQILRLFIENVKVELIAPKRPYLKSADTEPEFKSFKKETWNEIKENIAEIHKKYLLSRL